MLRYIAKRLGLAVLTVFVVTTAIFFMTNILPGDPATRILGNLAEAENVAKLRRDLGLDKPIHVQYWNWLSNTVTGDFGNSIQHRIPVTDYIIGPIGLSLRLAAVAFLITVPISILGGITAGVFRGRAVDRTITVGGLSAAVVPEFVWAVLLVFFVGVQLRWLPTSAYPGPDETLLTYAHHLIMPSIALVLVLFGYISRIARAGVIEAFDSDYVRTAVLKGLPRRTAVNRHVLRNALLPTIAVVASQVPYLIGGLVAVERVFNYPGFGTILIKAVQYRDYPVLQSSVLIVAVVIVLAQLLADILFAVLNPRIRQGIEQ
jgi:peptide/nickel transport system permease protein